MFSLVTVLLQIVSSGNDIHKNIHLEKLNVLFKGKSSIVTNGK